MFLISFVVALALVASSVTAFKKPVYGLGRGLASLKMSESVNDFAAPTPDASKDDAAASPSLISLETDEPALDLEALSAESSKNTFTTKTGESVRLC